MPIIAKAIPQALIERVRADLPERIHKDAATGCWVWQGSVDSHGYGRVKYSGKTWYAHRVCYALARGSISSDLQIDHLCRNTLCVNPEHLEPVTLRENWRRGLSPNAVAHATNRCKRGHELTPDNVYRSATRPNSRLCRTCQLEWHRQRNRARKEQTA